METGTATVCRHEWVETGHNLSECQLCGAGVAKCDPIRNAPLTIIPYHPWTWKPTHVHTTVTGRTQEEVMEDVNDLIGQGWAIWKSGTRSVTLFRPATEGIAQ
jgi:hypothetical protein